MNDCSRFYQDRNLIGSGRPSRIPENPDVVGTALARLAREHNSKPSIRGYVAFWHKMRASMFLRLGWRRRAIREILLALRHDPGEKKLYAFIILSMMPASAISFAFRRFSAQRTTGMGEKAGCA